MSALPDAEPEDEDDPVKLGTTSLSTPPFSLGSSGLLIHPKENSNQTEIPYDKEKEKSWRSSTPLVIRTEFPS